MVASWELLDSGHRGTVLCAIIHAETTSIQWAVGLQQLDVPGEVYPVSGYPYDHARNACAMACLDKGHDWLFFLDSDVIPPRDAIHRLMRHNQPIISGVYHRRSPPWGLPVMQRFDYPGGWLKEYPPNKVIEVDLVGAGCLLIHSDVLRKLPAQRPGKHWFDWRADLKGVDPNIAPGAQEPLSEDFTFCMFAKRHGYKVLVDTSIQCDHLGLASYRRMQIGPPGTIPVT